MICLRCGYCCLTSWVVIVDDPEKGPEEGNLKGINCLEESCPHLRGDTVGEYGCAIHNYPWYEETPCFSHGQIERSPDTPCRMGSHLLSKKSLDEEKNNGGFRLTMPSD